MSAGGLQELGPWGPGVGTAAATAASDQFMPGAETTKERSRHRWGEQETGREGTSLAVQWLRLHLPMQRAKIPHASQPKKPKHKTEAIL